MINTTKKLLLVLILSTYGLLLTAQTVTLGVRSSSGNSGVLMATNNVATGDHSRTAAVYTAAEIIAAGGFPGKLTKLWWSKEGTGEYTSGDAQIRVFMHHVTYTSHGTSTVNWADLLKGDTVRVFENNNWSIPTGTGWKQVTLTKPFVWNGTDNIEVLVEFYRASMPTDAISWAYSSATLTPASTNANAAKTSATGSPGFAAVLDRNNNRPLIQLELVDTVAVDASIQVITPGLTRAAGLDSVSVVVTNRGGLDLASVELDWEIDGVLQTGQSLNFNPFLLTGQRSDTIKLGNYTFGSGNHLIRAWSKNPNNQPDKYPVNDTVSFKMWVPYTALSGIYTIDPALSPSATNFKSFTEAVRALNESGISGTVYFNVAANATFYESNILISATGRATDSIVFRKNGIGNNPLIIATRGTGARDFIIGLEGSDYIVFDGINVQDSDPLNTTTDQQMESGFALYRKTATDGSNYNTIRNCRIELKADRTSGVGIYVVNTNTAGTTVAATAASGTSSFNQFHNDSVINCNVGISINGTSTLYDTDNMIGVKGGNVILNFSTANSSNGAIHVTQHNNTVISNNYIHSGNRTTTLKGINTLAGLNSNLTVSNNTLTLITSGTGASSAIISTTGAAGINNSTNFFNNKIIDCYVQGGFVGIQSDALAKQVNVYNNTIENDSFGTTGSVYLINLSSASGDNSGVVRAYDNVIRNIKRAGSTSTMYGFYSGQLIANGETYLYNNQVYNIYSEGSTGTVAGIHVYAPSGLTYHHVYRNRIYNIKNQGSGVAIGLNLTGANGQFTGYAYNNFISDIGAPYSSNSNAAIGINATIQGTYLGLYYNTVYLADTAKPTALKYGNSGISINSLTALDFRNNIVSNISIPGSDSGIVAAYRRSTSVLNTYSDSSNNNIFYTGNPGNRRYIFYDGTDSALTIGSFRNKMATRDQSSVGLMPPFINGHTAPYDLHIDATIASPVESGGRPVALPIVVNTDFDGNTRNAQTPDIGADEGTFVGGDFEGPSISYVKLKNTSSTANRTLEVTISDPSGLNVNPSVSPLLYYRKIFQGFNSVAPISSAGNVYTFEINYAALGGAFFNDVIEYYVAAQDLAPPVNVSTSPEGGYGAFPAGYYAPADLNSYIIAAPLSGAYYVGKSAHTPGANYPTLKDAFADYAVKGLAGPVEFILIDTLYSSETGETLPITINENPDASAINTLTVKPAPGVHVLIDDTAALNSSMVKLNGCDYVIIDGLNKDDASLGITNRFSLPTKTSMNAVVWISSATGNNGANNNTIKNCTIQGLYPNLTQIGIFSGTTMGTGLGQLVEANNNGNTIDSNVILKAQYGVLMIGSTTSAPALKNQIRYNKLGGQYRGEGFHLAAIQLTRQDSTLIANNDIRNVYGNEPSNSDGHRSGVSLWNSRNVIVRANKIHDIRFEGTGTCQVRGITTTALAFKTVGLPSNNQFINNVIYDLTNTYYGLDGSVSGINFSDGYGDRAYFNTISLSGQLGTTNSYSAAITLGHSSIIGNSPTAGTNIDIRNNLLSVTGNYGSTSTTRNLYAYYSKIANFTSNTANRNILYVNGTLTGSAMARLNTTEHLTLANWRTASGQEANSLAVDPRLNGPLLPIPYANSPALNAGAPVAGITTDINGVTRSATTPSIGAYETGGDFRAPDISFTPLRNTSSVANRTTTGFSVITDNSGVNMAAGVKPRLYFKRAEDLNQYNGNTSSDNGWKWVETNSVASPYNFVIDYSLLNSGTAKTGDTIQYFIMAQDSAPISNVASSAELSDTAFSVNLSQDHFPVSGFASYHILPQTSGYVYVGAGEFYKSLTNDQGFFDALKNNMILSGDVTVIVNSDLNELGTFDIGTWQEDGAGNYKIRIKPDQTGTLRTVSGNSSDGLIRFNGAKGITIDGTDTLLGSGEYLRFVNTSTTGPVFLWINNSESDTVTHCIVQGDNTGTSSGLLQFGTGGNRYHVISHNLITGQSATTRYSNGIYTSATSANPNSFNSIVFNRIFNFGSNGISNSSTGTGTNWNIISNHFYDTARVSVPTSSQTAISFTALTNCRVDSNFVGGSTINAGGAKWLNDGNTSFEGISVSLGAGSTVKNNIITNIQRLNKGTSASFNGLSISGGSPVVQDNVIGDSTNARSILLNGGAILTGLEVSSGVLVNVTKNVVANIAADSVANTRMRGMSITASSSSSQVNITENRIYNLSTFSNANSMTAGSQAITGMYVATNGGTALISKNLIHDIRAMRADSGTSTIAAGLILNKSNITVSSNRIYAIRNLAPRNPYVPASVVGALMFANSSNDVIANNMISLGHDTTDNIQYVGIWNYSNVTSGSINILHNSISLYGNATDTMPSYGIWRGTSASAAINTSINAINNIIRSQRSGYVYAMANTSSTPLTGWGAQSLNNNIFDISGSSFFGLWGTARINDLATWKTQSRKDSASLQDLVYFVDPKTADLHLTSSSIGNVNLAGSRTTGITTDFDGDTRNITPYIGADENTSFPVPVKLTTFNASRIKNDVLLSWITASEKNASHFVVEASVDGKQFKAIGELAAKGNSSVSVSYKMTHVDAQRTMNGSSTIYYRLNSVDKDGSSDVSKVVMVKFDEEPNTLDAVVAYPNPFNANLILSIPATENAAAEITLMDMQGRTVATRSHTLSAGSNEVTLNNLDELKAGIYFVKLNVSGESKVIKLVKN